MEGVADGYMKSKINIGTSGFRLPQAEYAQLLSCVEVQHTFYQPPQLSTLQRWRTHAPSEFEFTLKAWQLITHEATSPTYRRLKKKLTEEEKKAAGFFKATPIVEEAWSVTLACAKALQAKTILFQCPASFRQSKENIANLKNFFSRIKREELNCCWEPRGKWDGKVVQGLCEDLALWHVIDPFVGRTVTPDRCYFRLHGRKGWRYQYEEDELAELALMLPQDECSYVFFNNIHMTEDALKFKEIIRENY